MAVQHVHERQEAEGPVRFSINLKLIALAAGGLFEPNLLLCMLNVMLVESRVL